MAVLCHEREPKRMKTNQYGGYSEPFSVPYLADEVVDRTDQEPEHNRTRHNPVFTVGNSQAAGTLTAAAATRGPFPLRTLMVCITIWLIATQAMILDQVKFETRVHLLEQATSSFGGRQPVVPNEPLSNPPNDVKAQRL
jgi:hypothetical protein